VVYRSGRHVGEIKDQRKPTDARGGGGVEGGGKGDVEIQIFLDLFNLDLSGEYPRTCPAAKRTDLRENSVGDQRKSSRNGTQVTPRKRGREPSSERGGRGE